MALRVLRAGAAVLLAASGALMYAASWQRWAGACPWADSEGELCTLRQDHLYDFLPPSAPWQPVGDAAQLAGWSLLVLALAFLLLPWALTGRRPGHFSAVALVITVAAMAAVGIAMIRSGLTGSVVTLPASDLAVYGWALIPPFLLVRWAVEARGWAIAAAASLVLATPLVAAFSYAIGSYDARPWWEAISGAFTVIGGGCLLVDAVVGGRLRAPDTSVSITETPSPTSL